VSGWDLRRRRRPRRRAAQWHLSAHARQERPSDSCGLAWAKRETDVVEDEGVRETSPPSRVSVKVPSNGDTRFAATFRLLVAMILTTYASSILSLNHTFVAWPIGFASSKAYFD
jgi:hypothetical protein